MVVFLFLNLKSQTVCGNGRLKTNHHTPIICLRFLQDANIQSQDRGCQVKRCIYFKKLNPNACKSSQKVGYDFETTL
jgi:hypothetical protein